MATEEFNMASDAAWETDFDLYDPELTESSV